MDADQKRRVRQRLAASKKRSRETSIDREKRLEDIKRRYIPRCELTPFQRAGLKLSDDAIRSSHRVTSLYKAAFVYDPSIDYASDPLIAIGDMDRICNQCNARCFRSEPVGICCSNGKIRCRRITMPPAPVHQLFMGESERSLRFLKNLRRYNSSFQMTSFGSTSTRLLDGWQPTFRIQGQIYHCIGSLLPRADEQPKFLQVYFIGDKEIEIDTRTNWFKGVDRDIIEELQTLMDEKNDLVRSFRTALERMPLDTSHIVIRSDITPAGEHCRKFNAPTEDEVAIILVDGDYSKRDVVLYRRNGKLKRIDEFHPYYDALQYPLIFWSGAESYHFNLRQSDPVTKKTTAKKISTMAYYSYQLMIRDNEDFILRCGGLTNQFVVDIQAKIETERLRYIRYHQEKLRVDEYIHLKDAMMNDNADPAALGQKFILPSTFIGGPRHMHEYTQDALSYVRLYGCPDLFITFTCNSRWPELSRFRHAHQAINDRHDIIARVFRQKVKRLMDAITKYHLFGEIRCFMYTIEWQKRGLPHTHILIWCKNKIRPDMIDDIISAELPDPSIDPLLYEIITDRMIHGPCGFYNLKCPCMDSGKCTKNYPKSFISDTQSDGNGYPLYRRLSPEMGGQQYWTKSGLKVDNSWVVPYSPILCKMFNAHINVEYCNSISSIKYICKYINKGSDMASIQIDPQFKYDEISQYQLGRYISTNEAFWRIFGFPIHERYPAVLKLDVHLMDEQRVKFTPNNVAAVIKEPLDTTLTAFFKLCKEDEWAQTLLYSEVTKYYTWNPSCRVFVRRKRGKCVGLTDLRESDVISRVINVHPIYRERFFLRLLLHNIRGPQSFESLYYHDKTRYETYQDVCLHMGLLESDKHWEDTLTDAVSSRTPNFLRNLFAMILTSCQPSDPQSLWDLFKNSLSEDILFGMQKQYPASSIEFCESIYNEALLRIDEICSRMGSSSIEDFGFIVKKTNLGSAFNPLISRETNYNVDELKALIAKNLPMLKLDQREAYDTISNAIEDCSGGLFFIDAPGGTGKTFLINLLLAKLRSSGLIVMALASSGIAATLLQGGKTAHSGLSLPLNIHHIEEPTCNIKKNSHKGHLLAQCSAIIWDECTMAHKKSLEALDTTLRDIRDSERLMGGLVVILAGDFRQTLPVMRKSTPADELNACLKRSRLWSRVRRFTLRTNMRAAISGCVESQEFSDRLLRIGEGSFPNNDLKIDLSTEDWNSVPDIDTLVDRVFPNIQMNVANSPWLNERAILAPKNESVDRLNESILEKFSTEPSRIYLSIDSNISEEQVINYPIEFLNSLNLPGLPPHSLKLKIGAPIMLLRNLDPPKLCNGTRLIVKEMYRNVIKAEIIGGLFTEEMVLIPRIPIVPSDSTVEFKRLQFPVRLAFAMTINKSQGQSIKVVGIDLTTPCFSHGQLYVACSRVGDPKNLHIYAPENRTKNIVYHQALE